MSITASVQPELGRIVLICRIRLTASVSAPFFPKKAWITLCKTDPGPIWTAWSGFGQTHLVWKQAGVQELSGPVSGRTPPARYQFPTFRLGSVLPQTSRTILCKSSPGPIWFCLIVRFWPNRSGPEASRCARIIRPTSVQCFPPDPDRIRIGSGMFTGSAFQPQ